MGAGYQFRVKCHMWKKITRTEKREDTAVDRKKLQCVSPGVGEAKCEEERTVERQSHEMWTGESRRDKEKLH